MQTNSPHDASLDPIVAQLIELAPDKRAEAQDFIAFLLLKQMRRDDIKVGMAVSQSVFARYWDNEDDAEYDKL